MNKFFTLLAAAVSISGMVSCGGNDHGVEIRKKGEGFALYVDGAETYIKGIGGTNRMDIASANGANACRTWGGDIESIRKNLAVAGANNMYVMQGISLPKDPAKYFDEQYKEQTREFCRQLATEFKDDPTIIIWGIGNEVELGKADIKEAWCFINELAEIIKSIDTRHIVSTVVSHKPSALDSIARYAPAIELVGINSYGSIDDVSDIVARSSYAGPYMITEWGPTGWWESPKTSWGAPIEQTSEEKRIVYETRYNNYILNDKRCLGSFVFLWGQKEERTPTWFSMFAERNVAGLPLDGEKTPMVEAMERVWTGMEPVQTAPVVESMTINDVMAIDSPQVDRGKTFTVSVSVTDRQNDSLTYVWEILEEATVLGFGGSYEPRPERLGEVQTTPDHTVCFCIDRPGNFRVYCYILDGTGFVSTANVPIRCN